ncbi:phage tail tape measure protein [Sphingomonas sp. Mn802worker]|uniref:phage tail tape measure protein n=1 Tax=Sphingomonas sp. Mn802worker TaxID=629773 RepID=UPI0003A3E3FE|nr:phage tail tape measure protein [Sphingomonas sp. Mn802worker]
MDRNLRIRMLLEAGDKVSRPLREIAGGSTKAADGLRATRDRLKEIDRAQTNIAGFRGLKAGLRQTESALDAARARAAALGRQVAQTQNPTRALTRDFNRAKVELQQLERQQQAETRQLGELRDRLRTAGIATNDLARHERELRREAGRTSDELRQQEQRLGRLADRERRINAGRARFTRMQGVATGLAASGAAAISTGVVMAAPLITSVKAAQEYESVMTDIGQKADLSRAASEKLGRNLLVAARAANQMPADLQAGVDTLAGLGAKVPDAVRMMTPIGRAATAYKAEIADLSAAAYAATDNLKVPIAQTGKVIDIMATAGKAGAFEIKDMAQYFPALTAAYQGLGQTGSFAVADLAAGLQITRKGAGDAATAGTNLANILQKIASPATNKAFEKMGVDLPAALKKAYAEGKTPLEAIAELTNKTLKGDLSKLGYLFEDAQVQQGLRPLIQNMQLYRQIRAEAAGAGGTTDSDFAVRMQDSAEQTKQLKINATTLAVTLGAQLLPAVNAVVVRATAFATWVSDVANRYPGLTRAIGVGAAAFASLFFVLGGGAIVIAGLVAPFAALSFAAGALGIGLLPVIGIALAVVAGVVAIGAAAYAIYANWGAITGWFAGVWSSIKATGVSALAWFAALPLRFAQFGRDMISGLIRGVLGMVGALRSTIVGVASSAASWFAKKLDIHSPSRVFAGFGGNIIDGLTNGIAAQESEPVRRMDSLSRRLSLAIVSGTAVPALAMASPAAAASAAGAGSVAGARTYNITINQQPGEHAQDLARLIADEIDRRERETAARGRSSYGDTPDWETP